MSTAIAGALALATRLVPVQGLDAAYFPNLNWTPPAIKSTIGTVPSTRALEGAFDGAVPEVFSATWSGSFIVMRGGSYRLATVSDDASAVYVDGRLVVDNGGRHGPTQATGQVSLGRGVHSIFVEYNQAGGGYHLALLWARGAGSLERMPGWVFAPRRIGFLSFALAAGIGWALAVAEWVWVAVLTIVAIAVAWRPTVAGVRWLVGEAPPPVLGWIVAGSSLLIVLGVWWGLPGGAWAPDEITPSSVVYGAAMRYSHGWYNAYPPFHFYLLTLVSAPELLLNALGRIDLGDPGVYNLLAVVDRLVTVLQGIGTVIATYAIGARAFGRRAGLWASATFALVAPFLYYAKTTNFDVPYLFWFALSLVFYLRALEKPRLGDLVGFAATATLSVCTKDQAYGLFVLPPLAIVYRVWELRRGQDRALLRALFDRKLLVAAGTAVALFALIHNLVFNWTGFVLHVRDITGTRSSGYKMFPSTLAGYAGMLRLTAKLTLLSMGWPLFLISLAGLAIAVGASEYRRIALWLAIPPISYYFTLMNVVLYTYDRFLLPICLVLALFAGLALDRFVAMPVRSWRAATAAVVFGYTLLYSGMVDVLLIRDSRYAVERWLAAHAVAGESIGYTFPLQYYPRLERFRIEEINSTDDLERARPAYFVLDLDYARAEPTDSPIGRLVAALEDGTAGYRPAFEFRQAAPWPWLPGAHPDLAGPRLENRIYSTLHHINPTTEVFKRAG